METDNKGREKNGLKPKKVDPEPGVLQIIAVFRGFCLFVWSGAIFYATYQVYLAGEQYLPWQSDPTMNPGPLTSFLGRGRETTDHEWITYIILLITKLIFWFAGYVTLKIVALAYFDVDQTFSCYLSTIMSWLFLQNLMGWPATLFLFSQPILFYFIMQVTRSKIMIWGITLVLLSFLNVPWYRSFTSRDALADHYFVTTAAWSYARCISFCFDTWDVTAVDHKKSLFSILSYCFYFPLVITGPIVLYSQFEKDILLGQKRPTIEDCKVLLKDLGRMAFWILISELVLHYIYFRPLSLTTPVLKLVNLWVICGLIYWLGQFFMMKYVVMYGVSTSMAKLDGLEMPPLPRCISYIHRYSMMWKDFDRGLYYFLIRYTYKPTLEALESVDNNNKIKPELRKFIASIATYTYVYVWHSVAFEILVWSALNCLGITIESIGSYLKRKVESVIRKPSHPLYVYVHHPLFWDFVIEPIVTIPLAIMSILTSVVFCGNLEAAIQFTYRVWNDINIGTILLLYCFTHAAVAIRTWREWGLSLIPKVDIDSTKRK